MFFKSIPNKKRFIEKLKSCCSAMSKFALNSPCLLQIIRYNGDYEIIISHDASNGNKYDFYKIFENITFDEFSIPEEDLRYFEFEDEAISSPLVISSVSISHEKIALKKTIVELGLKDKQSNTDSQNANTSELLMRDILAQIGRKNDIHKPFPGESNNKGADNLSNLDPRKLGLNDNDEKMIERFKNNISGEK